MTELELVRSATKRLRGFWLAAAAVLASAGLALVGFLSANSSADGSASEIDNYVLLNGASQCAASPDRSQFDLTANFTIESWIFPTSAMTSVEAMIMNKEGSYEVAIRSGTFQYAINGTVNNWDWRDTGIRAKADQWQHFAFTKANNTVTLYIDGVSVYTLTNATFANTNIQPSNLAFNVGCRANTAGTSMASFFGGRLDEVRLWTVARSQPDIARDMHLNKIAGASGLVGYWDFNEPSGSSVFDRSSLNGTLTLYGAPTRVDVKQVTALAGGETLVTFNRTYLPGLAGWTVPSSSSNVRATIIGGGGGGGGGGFHRNSPAGGGGGGASGQVLQSSTLNLSGGSTVSVIVGVGGTGGKSSPGDSDWAGAEGVSGKSSRFGQLEALGGERGWGAYKTSNAPGTGRHAINWADGAGGQGGSGSPFSAFTGGLGYVNPQNPYDSNGPGGGGAGSAGSGANATSTAAGSGGAGTQIRGQTFAVGGPGGDRGGASSPALATAATANSGNGGVGGRGCQSGGGVIGVTCVSGQAGADGSAGLVQVRFTPTIDQAFEPSTTDQATATDIIPTSAASSFSVEAWVYPTNLTGWKSVINQSPSLRDGASRHFIGIQDGVLHFIANGGAFISTAARVPVNQWTHIAMTANGSSVVVYLNGVEVYSNSSYARGTAGSTFHLGGTHVTNEVWSGSIDQLKVWSAALTAAEVQASMHTYSSSGVAKTLVTHFDFNSFNPGFELDRSGNGRSLTLASSVGSSNYSETRIVETGTVNSPRTFVKFNRSYLSANGGWTPPSGVSRFTAFVVGGGGGGGSGNPSDHGGGGGGGGQVLTSTVSPTGPAPVVVGQGGLSANTAGKRGSPGQSSSFGTLSSMPGGAGAGYGETATAEWTGGGGAAVWTTATDFAPRTGAAPSVGRGFAGGNGSTTTAGGGGGSGGPGQNHDASGQVANGGIGVTTTILGTSQTYGAGGGGGLGNMQSGSGGNLVSQGVGGGAGANPGSAGAANSGGGGGGGSGAGGGSWRTGGSGGSGVVILSFEPDRVPLAPSISAISPSSGSLSIAFMAGDGGGLAISNYQFSTDGGATWKTRSPVSTASPMVVSNESGSTSTLSNGVSYGIRIRAVNQLGAGDQSGLVSSSPRTVPGQPINVSATQTGTSSANVTFLAPTSNGGSEILSFTATSTPGSISASVTQSGSGTISISGLTPNTSYSFIVTATNIAGTSSPSVASGEIRTAQLTHVVSFGPNGGVGATGSQTITRAVPTQLTPNSFSRSGFIFRSWNTQPDGTGTNYGNQEAVSISSNLSLFAQWSSIEDLAWKKTAPQGNYAFSESSEIIPRGTAASWSVEAWIRPQGLTDASQWTGVFGQTDSGGSTGRYSLWFDGRKFHPTAPHTNATIDFRIQDGVWSHIAWTMEANGTTKLYLNGTEFWTADWSSGRTVAGPYFTLGGTRQETNQEFPGEIDQFKVWNSSLTATQVQASMHTYSSSGVTGASLRVHYDFNEFVSGSLRDMSGNGRHLSLPAGANSSEFTSSGIVTSGTAHTAQNFVQFNRTYLTATGGWTPPVGIINYKAVVVAGGGGGGALVGGGGGAGGYTSSAALPLSQNAVPVVVGAGGFGAYLRDVPNGTDTYTTNGVLRIATNGQISRLGSLSVLGGGRGATHDSSETILSLANAKPLSGGSGGGGGGVGNHGDVRTGGAGTPGQGFAGGTATGGTWIASGGGGAGQAGFPGISGGAGRGGNGLSTSLTGTTVTLAGGGGGGNHAGTTHGLGGAGGGGAGALYDASNGAVNTGGGGGGAGGDWTKDSSGGSGGSGVVILSWGPALQVSTSPAVARAGAQFSEAIQLRQINQQDGSLNTASVTVSVVASAAVLTFNGNLTTTHTITSSGGVATFNGLGFASSVSGPVTLTFTSDSLMETTMVINPSYWPTNVNITNTGSTQGLFRNGEFFASTSSSVINILAADLQDHLSSFSTVISASGAIDVLSSFSAAASTSDIVLMAGTHLTAHPSQQIRTNGGDIVLWSNRALAGGVVRLLGNATLCTTFNACTAATAGGGDIVIGGGLPDSANNLRPAGFATGQNSSNNVSATNVTTGVQLGTLGTANSGARLYSAGGGITVRGKLGPNIGTGNWGQGVVIQSGAVVNSGTGKILIVGETNTGAVTGTSDSVGMVLFNPAAGSTTLKSISTASDSIVVEGREAGNSAFGIFSNNPGTVIDSPGGFVLRSDHISNRLALSMSVSSLVAVESLTGSLRGAPTSTTFAADFANAFSTGEEFSLVVEPATLRVGSASNSNTVTFDSPFSTAGDIEVLAGSVSVSAQIATTGSAKRIRLVQDALSLSQTVTANNAGRIEISPRTNGRGIVLGAASASALAIPSGSAQFLVATTLQLGSASTGNIRLEASTTFAAVDNLRLTTPASVTATTGAVLTTQNLAITAGGGVNLPGNNSASAVAISASSMVTYSSAVSYSPVTIDGVLPRFGVGSGINQIETSLQSSNSFLAVTFNPPPKIAITDFYGKALDANNNSAYQYSVSASVASGSGTVTGLTTSSRVGGVVTFTDLRVLSNIGVYAFTFSASLSPNVFTARSVDYNVMAGEPGQLQVIPGTTSAQAGKTSLSFTVIVRDAFGNAITAGEHKNISVSASISGTTATLISGGEVRANDSGIATFSNLIVSGSVSDTITISFRVSFTPLAGGTTTVTSSGTLITLTPGDASRVLLNTPAAGAGSRVAFTTQPQVSVIDAYGNAIRGVAYSISASVSAGVTLSPATATVNTVSGIATFVGSSISGTVGNYSISYRVTSAGGSSIQVVEQPIALSWGVASRLSVSATALTVTNRVTLDQLQVSVLDASGNTVGNGTQQIQATVSSVALTGTTQVFASSGIATFNALTISGQVGTHNLTFSASGVASASVTITLQHGAAASVDLTVSATAKNAQTLSTQPVVRILDADGNLVTTGAQSTQTVELIVSPGTLTGTTQISASAGIATFSGIALQGTVGSHTLTGRIYLPSTLSDNETITLGFGNATKLTLETPGAGAVSGVALSTQPVLKLRDSSNNEVTGVAHNVVATLTPAASTSGTTVAVNTSTAIATFTALSVSGTVGSYTISFAIEGASSSDVASVSQSVTLTHGAAVNLRVVSQPTSGNAGVTLSPLVVEVIDARGNRVTSGDTASKTVTITGAFGTTLVFGTKSVSLSAGIATFDNLSLDIARSQFIKFAVAGLPTAQTADFTVLGGAPSRLGFTCGPLGNVTAGANQQNSLCVRVYDQFGNFATRTSNISITVEAVSASDTTSVSKTVTVSNLASTSDFIQVPGNQLVLTKVGVYKFKASATSLESGLSENVTITNNTNASQFKLVMVQDAPASIQSGLTFSPAVRLQVQDTFGNPVVNATYSASVSRIAGTISAIAGGVASSPSGSSFIDFPDLALTATNGSTKIRFTANFGAPSTVDSNTFTVTSGDPFQLSVSPTARTVASRATLDPLTVRVLDRAGNIVASSQALITTGISGVSLSGTTGIFASSGQAQFSDLVVSGTAGTYDLSLSSSGLVSATVSVTLGHGVAASVDLTVSATARNAQNLATQPVVRIIDADGNLVTTGAQSTQTVELIVSPGTLTGTTRISASAGVATFSGVALSGTVGSHTLTGRISLPSQRSDNETIDLSFGVATKLTLDTPAAGAASGIDATTQPVVTLRDSSNNIVTGVTHTINIGVSPSASLTGAIAVDSSSGIATFTSLRITGEARAYTLSYSVQGASSSAVTSVSQQITLTHGVASSLRVVSQPTTGVAGVTLSPLVVEVIDASNNRVTTGFTSSASIRVSTVHNSIIGSSALSLSAGVATFNNIADTESSGDTLRVAVLGISTLSVTVQVSPDVAVGLRVNMAVSNRVAGVAQTPPSQFSKVGVALIDRFGNGAIAASTVSVTITAVRASDTSSVSRVIQSVTISQAANFVDVNYNVFSVWEVGTFLFKASASGLQDGLNDSSFEVTNAAASRIALLQDFPSSIQAGITFSPTLKLQLQDNFGNPVLNSTASVSVSAITAGATTITGGVASNTLGNSIIEFPNLAISRVGGVAQIRFSATSVGTAVNGTSISSTVQITSGNPYQLSVSPVTASVGNRVTLNEIAIKVLDAAGNLVSGSNDQVSAALSGASLSGTTVLYSTNGIASFSDLVITGQVGTYNLGFSSPGLLGTTVSVTVTHGAANYIQLTAPSSTRNARTASAVTATIFDAEGNRVTSGTQSTQTVTLTANGASISGVTAISASAGIATFSNVALRGVVGTKSISATIQLPGAMTASQNLELTFGDPYRLDLTTNAAGFVNRVVFDTAPVVTVRDVSDNVVQATGMNIRVSVSTASISGSVTASAATGVANFASNLVLRGLVGTHTLTFTAEGTSSSGVISASQVVSLTHGAASQLVVTTSSAQVLAGINFGQQPSVQLRDPEGNLVTTTTQANSDLTVSYAGADWSTNQQGVDLSGTQVISFSAGIATFTDLRLSGKVGSYTLKYTSAINSNISVSEVVVVAPGNATKISQLQGPQDVVAGEQFGSALRVQVLDAYDNRVTRLTSSTTVVARLISSASDVLETSAEVGAQGGVVTFSGLVFTTSGQVSVRYEVGANSSVSPLTSTTSATFTITHAAPDSIQWLYLPASTVQNDFIIEGVGASRPQLIAKDRFGNVVDTGTVKISVSSIVGTPQALTGGQVDAVSGSATIQSLKLRATVGSYTLRFAASTLANSSVFSSISHVIEVTHGVATNVVATTHPTSARANVAFNPQPVIEIRDSAGNRVSGSSAVIAITATGATLDGQSSLAASSGISTFTSVKLTGSASSVVTMSYQIQGTDISVSQSLPLGAGPATTFDLDWTTTNIQTRAAISPAPKLILRDADGNKVLSDASTQGVAKLMRSGSVVTESALVTAASGEINFAGLTYIATPGDGYSLRFEAAGLPAVTTSDFVVLPGPVSQVQIFIEPGTTIGSALSRTGDSIATQPKIRLLDVDGNLVTTVNSGTVSASIASGVGGQLLTASASVVNGVATFTQLGLIGKVETPTLSAEIYTLQFGYGGFTSSPSVGLSVMHNVATQISLLTPAAGGRSGLTFTTKPQVVLLDRFGNRVFKDAAESLVASPTLLSGSGAPGVVNNDQGAADSAGVYTFDMGISGLVGNTYGIDFLKIGGGLTPAAQSGITITHGNANKIGFLTLPSSTDSNQVRTKTGQNLLVQPVIEIQDAVGNRVLNASFTVTATLEQTFRGSRDFLRGHTVSAVSGVATFTGLKMIVDPAQLYRLNFTFGLNVHTAPTQLQVTHADAEYLTIATAPDGGNKTGSSLSRSPIITVHDFDGNLTTSLNGASVSALIASGGGSVVVDGNERALVQGGIAQFSNLKIVALPGVDQRLYFNLDGYQNSASQTVTSTWSNPISVTFSDAHKLRVFQQPCTGANCGIGATAELLSTQPVVEVQDFYGNRVTDFVGSITVTAQGTDGHLRDANARIASVDAVVVSGLATFNSLRLEGRPNVDYRLSFAVGSLVSTTSDVIQVKNTVADYLAITTQPVGGVTGAVLATQPVVEIRDRFDNVVVDYSGTIQASVVSGPNRVGNVAPVVSGSATATVTNGVATFNGLRLIGLVNRDYVLGFSDGTRSVSSANVRLAAASAATVELVNTPAAFRTGDPLTTQPVLRILDFDGNLAVSTSVTITAGVSSGGGYIESGTVSSAVTGGYVTFSNLVLVAPVGVNQQLSFTATTAGGTFSVNTTTALNVRHTDIAYFQVQTPYVSGNYQQGAVLSVQPKLFAFDRYGNKAIFDNSTVVTAGIGSGVGGAVSGSATATVTAGEVQFSGLAVTGSPGVAYKLNFSANLVTSAYSLLNPDTHTVFKTAAIQLAYPLTVFSLSATVAPTVALTDSTEHAPVYTTTTAQFCSVNSSTGVITMLGAGSCVIRSTVANGTYYRSNTLDVTLPIAKADQNPVVITNANNVPFGQVLTLTSTGGSSTATTRFFATGECSILGDKLMAHGGATEGDPQCALIAYRAGDANFKPYTSPVMDITVTRIAQAPLSIGNSRNATVGEVELFTVGGSGTGTVSYTVQSQTGTQCQIVGNVLTSTGNGVCEISAAKAQDQNYNLATSPAVSFTFSKQVQQLSFTSIPPSMPRPGQLYQASATASSGLTISFAITMGQGSAATSQSAAIPAVCSISGSEVQFLRSGNCEITATQAGNSRFASATATLRINVGSLNQFITFPMIEDSVYGAPALRLNAEASSDLPVSYTVSAGITACTVTNGMVNFLAAGNCEIVATQAGDSRYAAAPPKSRAFRITPDRASAPSLVSTAVGNQWFTLRYTQPSYTGGSNIIGYRLEVLDQSSNSAGVYVNTACTTLTCTMAGIPNDKPYVARIAAITAAGVGQFSQYSRTMTPTAAQMGVTELAADVSSNGLDLSWIRPAAIEGNFSRYEVFVWVTGSTEPQTASAVVTNSSSSTISVPISSISSGVQIAPAASSRVAVIQPAMNITNRLFIFGAQATRPVGFVSLASVQSQTTASATVGYSMKVVTITDTFSSSMTINTANGLKIGLETPAAPTQLGLDTSDPTKILVTWAAPLSDGGFAIEDYKVVVNGQTVCANIQTRVCEISPLTVSTTYNVEVVARNALGFGEAAVASHTTPTPPPVVITDTRTTEALVRIPQLVSFAPKFARAGELVEVSGRKINLITELKLGDVEVAFTKLNDSTLRFRVPADTKPGTYDIQHFSEFGKVSVIDALVVISGVAPTSSPEVDTQSPVTPVTESPSTESPVDPTDPVDPVKPTDPEQGGGSNGGSGGSNNSGSEGSGSEGNGSGGGAGQGESDGGESEPGANTESENAGIDEPARPLGQNPMWWILLIALAVAAASYFTLRKREE